jgi:hypothetical protein
MAENTSVGGVTISLDLEASGDIKGQIEKMSANIGKQIEASLKNIGNIDFKSMADTISNTISKAIDNSMKNLQQNIQKTINSALSNIKGIKIPVDFANPTNSPAQKESAVSNIAQLRAPPIPKINTGTSFEAIKAQIDNLTGSIDITNAKIEQQQEKLAQLKESYNTTFNEARKNKLQEEILKTEANINKLIATSDKAGFKLADLDAQFAALGNITKNTTAGINAVNEKLKQTANTATKSSGSMKDMHHSMYSFSGIMRQFFTWMVVLPLIMKGITAISTGLRNMLKTNSQFANSLLLIKSNLMTAFMPIYQAVLPAINTLMSALAIATAYLASFLSQIFGKTYQQSFNAAKAMQTQVGALTQTEKQAKKTATSLSGVGKAATAAGNAAKSAAQGLASFDQINQLKSSNSGGTGSPGSGVITPITPMANMAPIESVTSKWANGFKKVLATIFQPFKNAWSKDGAGVTAEFNRAIEGTKATLKNFFNMLATPPVQQFLENIGRLVLAIVKLGLRIYDGFILPILNWFIDKLPGAAKGMNPIINAVTGFINFLSGTGFPVVQTVLGVMIAWKAATIAMTIAQEAQNAILAIQAIRAIGASGALGLFEGVTGSATVAQWLLSAATGASTVTQTAHTIAVGVWSVACGIAIGVTTAFGAAIAFLISPITLTILAIAALIAIGILLYKNWDTIKAKAVEVWSGIKAVFATFSAWLGSVFATDWSNKFGIFGGVLNGFFYNVKNIFGSIKQVFNGLIDFVAGVFTGNWSRAWNGVKNVFSGIVNTFSSIIKSPLNSIIGSINTFIRKIRDIRIDIPKVNIPLVGTVGGGSIGMPWINTIPYLAKGGVIDQPTLAMVGERGKEAVMPLENNTGWIDTLASKLNSKGSGAESNEMLQILRQMYELWKNLEISLNVDSNTLARATIKSLNQRTRMMGKSELII